MYAKFISQSQIEIAPLNYTTADAMVFNFNSNVDLMLRHGYKPVEEDVRPDGNVQPYYEEQDDKIIKHWKVVAQSDRIVKEHQIVDARAELARLDYKSIKRMQGVLSDEEWTETVARCEELRAQINVLEEEIAVLDELQAEK